MLTSASGRVFAAYMARDTVRPLIEREMANPELPEDLRSWPQVEAMLDKVRHDGYAAVSGYYLVPGVEALAAPVFNFKGEITIAMLVVGVQGMFDMAPDGEVVRALRAAAVNLSQRLGYTGSEVSMIL